MCSLKGKPVWCQFASAKSMFCLLRYLSATIAFKGASFNALVRLQRYAKNASVSDSHLAYWVQGRRPLIVPRFERSSRTPA